MKHAKTINNTLHSGSSESKWHLFPATSCGPLNANISYVQKKLRKRIALERSDVPHLPLLGISYASILIINRTVNISSGGDDWKGSFCPIYP